MKLTIDGESAPWKTNSNSITTNQPAGGPIEGRPKASIEAPPARNRAGLSPVQFLQNFEAEIS